MPKKTIAYQAHCGACTWISDVTDLKAVQKQVKQHLNDMAHPDYVPQTIWNLLNDEENK